MKYLVFDTETTTRQSGSPWNPNNELVYLGFSNNGDVVTIPVKYKSEKQTDELWNIWKESLKSCDVIVAFNAKFDLHWIRLYGFEEWKDKQIWDVQVAHFLMTNMTQKLPSLNDVADYWGIGKKEDKVAKYWEEGYNTDQIPEEILVEYLEQDVRLTEECFKKQMEWFKDRPEKMRLFKLQMLDLKILCEMEWNGMLLDKEGLLRKGKELQEEVKKCDQELFKFFPNPHINWSSDDHISACLYGGILKYKVREKYTKVLKSGEERVREHWVVKEVKMPRLVEPLKKTECAKPGYWKTNEKILLSLKGNKKVKHIINILLKRSKLMKAIDSYYLGFPNMLEEYEIKDNILHGQLNQSVAATGRLSSSNPNMQNVEEGVREFIITRY
jgi:DNA polymerase-1